MADDANSAGGQRREQVRGLARLSQGLGAEALPQHLSMGLATHRVAREHSEGGTGGGWSRAKVQSLNGHPDGDESSSPEPSVPNTPS